MSQPPSPPSPTPLYCTNEVNPVGRTTIDHAVEIHTSTTKAKDFKQAWRRPDRISVSWPTPKKRKKKRRAENPDLRPSAATQVWADPDRIPAPLQLHHSQHLESIPCLYRPPPPPPKLYRHVTIIQTIPVLTRDHLRFVIWVLVNSVL